MVITQDTSIVLVFKDGFIHWTAQTVNWIIHQRTSIGVMLLVLGHLTYLTNRWRQLGHAETNALSWQPWWQVTDTMWVSLSVLCLLYLDALVACRPAVQACWHPTDLAGHFLEGTYSRTAQEWSLNTEPKHNCSPASHLRETERDSIHTFKIYT